VIDANTELLAAAMDPRKILAGTAKLLIGTMREAAETNAKMRRRIQRFIATDEFTGSGYDYSEDDYDETLALLSAAKQKLDDQAGFKATELFATVPDKELATDIAAVAQKVGQWGDANIPREQDDSLLAPTVVPPSVLSLSEFMGLWQVAVHPMCAVYYLEDGMLMDEDVALLSQLYPAFYSAIRQAITDSYAAVAPTKPKSWSLPSEKLSLLRTMLQQDNTDAQFALALQQATAPNQEQVTPPKPSSSVNDEASNQESTPGSKAKAA
jgi:hypothetical protein